MNSLEQKIDDLLERMSSLEKVNASQSVKIDELTSAWNTAKGIVAIIRWTAGVGAGLATAWGVAKGFKI